MKQQINLDLNKTTPIICEKCDNQIFSEGLMLRKISRILTGTSQDAIQPIPVFYCTKCGHVNKEFLPIALQENNKNVNQSLTIV